MKTCGICKIEKAVTEYHRQASRKDGYCNWCKSCKAQKKSDEYQKNRESTLARVAAYRSANAQKVSQAKKAARLKKIDQYNERSKLSYESNKEEKLKYQADYRRRNWPKVLAWNTKYKRDRLRSDPLMRLEYALRSRTFLAFRSKGYKKSSRTQGIIGCDWGTLMAHMAAKFKPGMTMENYGQWHVDHIVPLSSAKNERDMVALCHFTNLQPLWASENIRKGAKVEYQCAA